MHNKDNSDLIKRIVAGARVATMIRLAAQVFSWLSTIVVVRFITPTDYITAVWSLKFDGGCE